MSAIPAASSRHKHLLCRSLYQPNLSYAISGSSSSGYAVTVTTNVAISAGTSLIFTYGQDSAGGFSVPG